MKKYIFGERAGIHIIDLNKTADKLNDALSFLFHHAQEGRTILFVSTKAQTQEMIPQAARDCGMPYITNRWLGGFLTNFKTIKKRIQYMKTLEDAKEKGDLSKYTKKEVVMIEKEIIKLNSLLSGVKGLEELPDVLFVVDILRDHLAVKEASDMGIPVVAFVDTNCNPELVDFPIPANDDAVRGLQLLINAVSGVINEGRGRATAKKAAGLAKDVVEELEVTKEDIRMKGDEIGIPKELIVNEDE